MTDKLSIHLEGTLPDAGKFAVLAKAEERAAAFAKELNDEFPGLGVVAVTKAIPPQTKKVAGEIAQATTAAPEPLVKPVEIGGGTEGHTRPGRHAA